jgi:hypothetical protein
MTDDSSQAGLVVSVVAGSNPVRHPCKTSGNWPFFGAGFYTESRDRPDGNVFDNDY